MKYIFISYSHKDREFVDHLEIQLQEQNFEVWRDNYIKVGSDWENELLTRIKKCHIFIVVMSSNSLKSKPVQKEIKEAISLDQNIIPILIEGSPFSDLTTIQYEDMTQSSKIPPKLLANIKKLLKVKRTSEETIKSLNYYVDELEKSLSRIVNEPVISEILKYKSQKKLLEQSINESLAPNKASYDIHKKDEIDEIFSDWEYLEMILRSYSYDLEKSGKTMSEEIEDLKREWGYEWEENPEATELSEPQKNYPERYDGTLFGDD